MSSTANLKKSVEDWLALDPNPETRSDIQKLWDGQQFEELEKRLSKRIEFGTAGLRGKMEAGWARMNDLIIIQASQGLAEYVLKHVEGAQSRGLVVGYDHRHHSVHWADLTAKVFVTKGIKVYVLEGFNHTPLVPFSVQRLNAACGVMITASHNPKQDNGYKVYWENAVQIIAPHDKGISDMIQTNLAPQPFLVNDIHLSELCINMTRQLQDEYLEYLKKLGTFSSNHQTVFVNTSMHGVGDSILQHAFSTLGLPPYIPVAEQQLPDPNFPTVSFPNPEEKGALDLAIATADKFGVFYVLAQDPDADRFTAAEKDVTGLWTVFTGDQLGSLFAAKVLDTYRTAGNPINKLAMIASTVSSKMMKSIAAVEGFKFVECLTGFKYIGNTALQLMQQGYNVPFGYEEAIGFMFGSQVRDKDGIAATVLFVELVTWLQSQKKTVKVYLQELHDRYGYFKTNNGYFVCNDPETIDQIFIRLRNYTGSHNSYPQQLGTLHVTRVVDLTTGYDSGNSPSYKPALPLSSGHMIQFYASSTDEARLLILTLRTSGTEPKIKYYLEGKGQGVDDVELLLQSAFADLLENWIETSKYNF